MIKAKLQNGSEISIDVNLLDKCISIKQIYGSIEELPGIPKKYPQIITIPLSDLKSLAQSIGLLMSFFKS